MLLELIAKQNSTVLGIREAVPRSWRSSDSVMSSVSFLGETMQSFTLAAIKK
jgi:hypothetical protein